MIWICGLPLTIKEVYIRPDYPVRLHPSPVRLIRPRLVKMKTHSTGAFMSFDQHDCALHLRNLSQPAFLFPASSSGAQPLLHRRSAFSPPGQLSLSAGKLLSLSNSGQLSRWSSQILVVKKVNKSKP
ncbi:hypothetical protein F2Q68_00040245 [Brassica cretica]|uniref:Uncharacterized protein n=1 Tax=Brassica cretica TaxID=69181 RepID=A0A8S9MC88_BRACR|nr:hypothetical protein F2Q68_00040245 [Brassica cretica]